MTGLTAGNPVVSGNVMDMNLQLRLIHASITITLPPRTTLEAINIWKLVLKQPLCKKDVAVM
jgi:hypothetical protein